MEMQELEGVKNIVFDIGGVLLNIDESLTVRELQQLAGARTEQIIEALRAGDVFTNFEKGLLSPAEFRNKIITQAGVAITDTETDRIWNATLLDFPGERISMLRRLQDKYRLFILSNTNEIHLSRFFRIFREASGGVKPDDLFYRCYYSCRIGMRKPDREIFQYVMKDGGILPSQTIFIDDTAAHIRSAQNIGWKTYHLEAGQEVSSLL